MQNDVFSAIIIRINTEGRVMKWIRKLWIHLATFFIFIMTTGAPIGLSISGTGLLIVVTVALENLRSVDSRALMITYDDFKNEFKD